MLLNILISNTVISLHWVFLTYYHTFDISNRAWISISKFSTIFIWKHQHGGTMFIHAKITAKLSCYFNSGQILDLCIRLFSFQNIELIPKLRWAKKIIEHCKNADKILRVCKEYKLALNIKMNIKEIII